MIFYWLTRFLFKAFAKVFLRLKVEGLENLPKEGGFVLASNHASSFDPFIIIAAIPRYIRWTVVDEYYDQRYFKRLLQKMRFIRLGASLPKEAFRALAQGEIVGIFPEGRRSWDGQLGQARRGVAALVRRTSSCVVPVAILGSYAALSRTSRFLKPSPVTVRIGEPLTFASAGADIIGAQKQDHENAQRIMQAIAELLAV